MAKMENRKKCLRKAREWAATYQGNHIVRDYHEKFHVDMERAQKIMTAIGATAPERLDAMRKEAGVALEAKETPPEPTPESVAAKKPLLKSGEKCWKSANGDRSVKRNSQSSRSAKSG